jgi:hypothetical protein
LQLKILLYQRKQIPDQMDLLVRKTTSAKREPQIWSQFGENGRNCENTRNGKNASNGDMRDAMRRRRELLRHKKLEDRYLQVL